MVATALPATAQIPDTAAEMYDAWCARCHAADGSGLVEDPTVKTRPMGLTDCRVASAEPDSDWALVIADGAQAAGLSPEMPGFGDVLSDAQVADLVTHLRGFCGEDGWPHGNLNFPRPIFTEKAYPENELVVLPSVSHSDPGPGVRFRTVYETRLGKRGHGEISLPFASLEPAGTRETGLGDVALAGKYVLLADKERTLILTTGLELKLPTGSERRGLGGGDVVFEPWIGAGTVVRDTYVQTQLKLEMPAGELWDHREFLYNLYLGRDVSHVLDTWTYGVELNGVDRRVALTPQLRKGLTRTGALAVAGGLRVPIVNRGEQDIAWVGYLLWEYLEPVRAVR